MVDLHLIGWLILRVTYAAMYILPLKGLIKKWKGTVRATAMLFPWQPQIFAVLACLSMTLGALSILFGFYGQLGALLLLVFNIGGAIIHFRCAEVAIKVQPSPTLPKETHDTLMQLKTLALIGHKPSAQKNLVLAAVALFFCLLGTGPWSLTGTLF